jgi:hypothetical protein
MFIYILKYVYIYRKRELGRDNYNKKLFMPQEPITQNTDKYPFPDEISTDFEIKNVDILGKFPPKGFEVTMYGYIYIYVYIYMYICMGVWICIYV